MPFDKWAVLDFANAVSNVICFGMFKTLTADDILNPATKEVFNWIQVFAVIVSWGRFLSFFLVIQSISILIITALKMLLSMFTFIALTISYIIVMVPIFQILFQEDTISYISFIVTARTLFDAMLGSYGFSVVGQDEYFHVCVLVVHILISNIFLLNYLIAILSTVYEEMAELGDFAYKSSKYQYIERYQIPMQDQWGYEELVVHPPPINYLTGLLTFCIFKANMMLRFSVIFSKMIFWLENIFFYIPKMFVYETLLIPLIYLRLIANIIRTESEIRNAIYLLLLWLIIGPVYLLINLIIDMYFYVKVLLIYHEDDTLG